MVEFSEEEKAVIKLAVTMYLTKVQSDEVKELIGFKGVQEKLVHGNQILGKLSRVSNA
jgi:hypothetical protein